MAQILESIQKLYPNLLKMLIDQNGDICSIYFNDQTISKEALEVDEFTAHHILFKNNDFYLSLVHIYQDAVLTLSDDIIISNESCIALFDDGVKVYQRKEGIGVLYEFDQVMIRRNYTIDNIVKE